MYLDEVLDYCAHLFLKKIVHLSEHRMHKANAFSGSLSLSLSQCSYVTLVTI